MEVQSGEALALVGPSGSAKSLFLRLLNLLGTVCRGPGSTSGFKAAPLTLAQARIVRLSALAVYDDAIASLLLLSYHSTVTLRQARSWQAYNFTSWKP